MAHHTANASLIINPRIRAYRERGHQTEATLDVELQTETTKRKDHYREGHLVITLNQPPRIESAPPPQVRVR